MSFIDLGIVLSSKGRRVVNGGRVGLGEWLTDHETKAHSRNWC
jgi:hypothetical protein